MTTDERLTRGIALLTAHLQRDPDATFTDVKTMETILGHPLAHEDVPGLLIEMLTAAELVMLGYQEKTDIRPVQVLQEIALRRESRPDARE